MSVPAPPADKVLQEDPFDVLGLPKDASDDDIKSAHRKLALKYHPDKNAGDVEAAEMFQKISTAKAILTTPELRQKYEAGGMDALDEAALTEHGIQVDVSQTGFVTAGLLAMFRKMGQPVKTVVASSILEKVASGNIQATPLTWNEMLQGRVPSGQAVFYSLDLTEDHLMTGLLIFATCPSARLKLLLWDAAGEAGEWNMCAEEDSNKVFDVNVVSLALTGGDTLDGVPSSMAAHLRQAALRERGTAKADPAHDVFRALDGAKTRDRLSLKPGKHLVAVYGDNFFSKAIFSLQAQLLTDRSAISAVEETDRKILDKRAELASFERDFKKARAEWEAMVERLGTHTQAMEDLFAAKQAAHADVYGIAKPVVKPAEKVEAGGSPNSGAAAESGAEGAAAGEAQASSKSVLDSFQAGLTGLFGRSKKSSSSGEKASSVEAEHQAA